MKKTRFLAALLCAMLLVTLLPTTALADADPCVWVNGMPLSAATPYYFNGGATGSDALGGTWNAFFEVVYDVTDNIRYVLHLKGLSVICNDGVGISAYVPGSNTNSLGMGNNALYIELMEGSANNVDSVNDAAVAGQKLILCGNGSLNLAGGTYGLKADSPVQVKYGVTLTTRGTLGSVYGTVGYPSALCTGQSVDSSTWNLTPKGDAQFNVWVGSVRVSAANMQDVLDDGGSVKYTPAGVLWQKLTLNNASVGGADVTLPNTVVQHGGIYAARVSSEDDSLILELEGASTVNASSSSTFENFGVHARNSLLAIVDGPGDGTGSLTVNAGNV